MDANFSDQRFLLEDGLLKELHRLLMHYQQSGNSQDDLLLEPLAGLLLQASEAVNKPYEEERVNTVLHAVDVLSLGKEEKEEPGGENGKHHAEAEAAYALASKKSPFALRYSSGESQTFSIVVKEDAPDIVGGILRGAFGQAAVKEAAVNERKGFYQAYAHCQLSLMDNASSEQPILDEEMGNWVDSLAQALPGHSFEAEFVFEPINDSWLLEHLYAQDALSDLLEEFSEISWQVSGNVGSGINDADPLTLEVINKIGGSRKISGNQGLSASLSVTLHRNAARQLAEELKFMMSRFMQMKRGGGWAVYLSVSSSKRETMDVVEAVLSGALAHSGFCTDWEEQEYRRHKRASILMPTHELPKLVCFPKKDFPGFVRKPLEDYDINVSFAESDAPFLSMGNIIWNGILLRETLRIPIKELNRHAFICGMTGSGKTNTVCHMLSAADKPFLVIEPVKGEYRSLQKSLPNTEVYTMEAGSHEMLSVNPFWFPKGSSLQYHIDSLKTIISSAFDLYAAMPNILEQCLLRVYINMGWNLITSSNMYEGRLPVNQLYPTFSDLCDEIEKYINSSDFEGETKGNYKGALLSRLQSFTSGSKGILLNDNTCMPFERWFTEKRNVVIELDALADDADKCIVMGTILTQYFQYIKYCAGGNENHELRHLVVLEEAHHLFMEDTQSSDGSNARKQLVESLSNLLAEIRAYGEGFLIIDQSPSRISPEVIKNTATKVVHRLDYGKDIDMMRDVLLLKKEDKGAASLEKGHAFIRYGTMEKPAKAALPLCESKEAFVLQKEKKAVMTDIYLVRSAADTIILNPVFRDEMTIACGMFVNQVLFDGLKGIRKAMYLLWMQCSNMIYNHGYQEMALSCGIEKVIKQLVLYGVEHCLDAAYSEQKFMNHTIKFYIQRLIDMDASQKRISRKEWELLEDFRTVRIQSRIAEYYSSQMDGMLSDIRAICEDAKYCGLIKSILSDICENCKMEEKKEKTTENLVKERILSFFYELPEKMVMDAIVSGVAQYLRLLEERQDKNV